MLWQIFRSSLSICGWSIAQEPPCPFLCLSPSLCPCLCPFLCIGPCPCPCLDSCPCLCDNQEPPVLVFFLVLVFVLFFVLVFYLVYVPLFVLVFFNVLVNGFVSFTCYELEMLTFPMSWVSIKSPLSLSFLSPCLRSYPCPFLFPSIFSCMCAFIHHCLYQCFFSLSLSPSLLKWARNAHLSICDLSLLVQPSSTSRPSSPLFQPSFPFPDPALFTKKV